MRAFIWFVVPTLLMGCPVEPEEDVASNATNNESETNNDLSNVINNAPNNEPNNGPSNAPNNGLEDVVVEIVPIEWGLRSALQTSIAQDASLIDGQASVETELDAGAFSVIVTADSTTLFDTTEVGDSLVPVSGEIDRRPFFVPARSTVRFEVSFQAGEYELRGQVLDAGTPAPLDANIAPQSAGSWFDEAFAAIEGSADPGGATVQLMHAIRAHGGPIRTDAGVLFVAPAQDGEAAPQIRGTWNNFDADPDSELRRITPGFWARFIDVPAGRQEYKIYYPSGDAWVTDVSNPHINWDGFDPGTLGSFNSVLGPQGSRTVWLPNVQSSELGNARDVYVHLPQTYDAGASDYPVLYVHDGNESIVRSQFHIIADETAADDAATESLLVFVALASQNDRIAEYTMGPDSRGDDYVDFIADTLVPTIDENFRSRTDRVARGLTGASLGGLISYWGAMQHPDIFGYTAGMSSTFWWPSQEEAGQHIVVDEIAARGCQGITYYLDSGSPADNFEITQVMRDTLDGLGCDYDYVLDAGATHDWSFWRARFDGVLRDFADLHGG